VDIDAFAHEWIGAWNSHDLDRILMHYADGLVFRSPVAARVLPYTGGVIRGKDEARRYWSAALPQHPALHFELQQVLRTVDGCTVLFRNHRGQLVAETMVFDEDGRVVEGIAAYADE
jgi:ketosteroid isomerase-like protein